jgi:hypothetical protein
LDAVHVVECIPRFGPLLVSIELLQQALARL